MGKLIVIGTSHIARQSIIEVKEAFEKYSPDIVAVELDVGRYAALLQKKRKLSLKDVKDVGFKAFILQAIGHYMQKKLGQRVRVEPGADMKTAIILANKSQKKVACIDQDVRITLNRLFKIPFKEKIRMFFDGFISIFKKSQLKEELKKIDLRKVPEEELIQKLMKEMKKRYPGIYRILVSERNRFMAKKLKKLQKQFPEDTILVVIGAGHAEEVRRLLAVGRKERVKA